MPIVKLVLKNSSEQMAHNNTPQGIEGGTQIPEM